MKHFGRYPLLLCLLLTLPAYANITIDGETVSVETDSYMLSNLTRGLLPTSITS